MVHEAAAAPTQYLTCQLGEETFAFEIAKVREVLDFTTITRVPRMPDFMRGVINLRGNVVAVVDLRVKFGMPKTQQTVETCVIITEVSVNEETFVLGALADAVQEVIDLSSDEIGSAPKIGTQLHTEFIKGIGRHNEHFVIILDIDKIFSTEELALGRAVLSDRCTEEVLVGA